MTPSRSAPAAGSAATDRAPSRWRALGLLALAELLGMSPWFAAAAVAPHLRDRWALTAVEGGWLTSAVQLGVVAGTAVAATFSLADLFPARRLFALSAVAAALANAGLLAAPGFGLALALRFATGFFLAGVYPPAMKMIATWFRVGRRGLGIGAIVGALVIGKAIPYLAHALSAALVPTLVWTSLAGLAAAALVGMLYADGPFTFERRPFSWGLAGEVWRDTGVRRAILGYLGHMWELYAMWAWLPPFLLASAALHAAGHGLRFDPRLADLWAFAVFAAGGAGCVWAGLAARSAGYLRIVRLCLAASGACCLAMPLMFGASPWLVVPLALVWGFFVVADSAQFSAMVTESAPPHAVGTALTLQTSLGFLLTLATLQLVPWIAGSLGWRWAFPVLALGPAAGLLALRGRGPHGAGPA